jgi:hypothetical protein
MDAEQYGGKTCATMLLTDGNDMHIDDEFSQREDIGDGADLERNVVHSSQEEVDDSQESLGTKVGRVMPNFRKGQEEKNGSVDEGGQRYSDRLADKYPDDMPILDRAKILAKSKNLDKKEGTSDNFCTVLDTSDPTLIDIASVVGVSLGSSLDMISDNISLLRAQEEARDGLFKTSRNRKVEECEPEAVILQPTVVDSVLRDMLSLTQEEMEEFHTSSLDQFQLVEN